MNFSSVTWAAEELSHERKTKKNGCKDFIRCLWLLSYVVMLLCHEWYVVNMSIYVHIHVVNWCRQDVKICQWFRSAESLGTVGPYSGQSACNIPHLVQMIRSSTRMPQQKNKKHVLLWKKRTAYSGSKQYCGSTQLHAASPASDWTNRLPMSARGW